MGAGKAADRAAVLERTVRIGVMIAFHNVIDPNQVILIACDQEADRVATIRSRTSRASSLSVPHIAKFTDCGIVGSIRCGPRFAHAAPQIT